ncbi:MAG: DUF4493 domain-containing protein [Rikenellaceae bacterium]
MKHITQKVMILTACVLFAVSCVSEDTPYTNENTTPNEETVDAVGYLEFVNLNISVDVLSEIVSKADDDTETEIVTDDYDVSIYSIKQDSVVYNSTLKELDALEEPLTLSAGDYTISVNSIAPEDAELCGWEYPTYGCTKEVTIISKQTTEIDEFVCTLSNIKTSVELSADLKDLFKSEDLADGEGPLNVSISLGESTLNYDRDESRCGYFKAIEESNELVVVLSGMYNLSTGNQEPEYTSIEWKQTLSGVTAGQWRKVSIRVENANDGNVTFEIEVETWTYDETIDVYIQSVNYSASSGLVEDSIYDPDNETTEPNSPVVTLQNDHDIDETFSITSSIFDFASDTCYDSIKADITPTSGSTVAGIDVTITSSNSSLSEALEAAGCVDGKISVWPTNPISEYLTIEESNGAIVATARFAAMRALYEYSGEHTIKIMAVDSQDRHSYTFLNVKSTKSSSSVDDGNGPSVVWRDGYDFDTTYEIDTDTTLPVVLDITSPDSGGITSFTVGIDSDVLTESLLSELNLATEMDLINPETDDMADALAGLKFPVGDSIEGATELEFNITEFMPALAAFGTGETTFELVVSDALGTTVRQIKLKVL